MFRMISRRRKLVILAGVFVLCYIYTVTTITSGPSLNSALHKKRPLARNVSRRKSPALGPVDDLLGDDIMLQHVEHDDLADALPKDFIDPFDDDQKKQPVLYQEDWKKGFRLKAGFRNPLRRHEDSKRPVAVEDLAPDRGIVNRLGAEKWGGLDVLDLPQPGHPDLREPADGGHDFKVRPELQLGLHEQELPGLHLQPVSPGLIDRNQANVNAFLSDDQSFEVRKDKRYGQARFPPFVAYGKPGDPGEDGAKYVFPISSLTKQEAKQKKDDFEKHFFEEWTSRKIALHRHLPDSRGQNCSDKAYDKLPAASVLIVFYNEAWTTLLRSVHSVLDRTPEHLLKEIVLLDDFSDMDHLKEPLEQYLQPLDKVRLLRATKRLGLIRARNLIFDHARGEVVIFLDSHIECFPGWIEPLLAPIQADHQTITYPVIEFINPSTFSVHSAPRSTAVGGLHLASLSFNWLYDRKINDSDITRPNPSPTMPGGLYAVSRVFFWKLGKYDPGMDLWGGENVEISFKAWMCGGSILLAPCSHVGHVFRHSNPALQGVALGYNNAIRVAEVWMDSYKHFFYERIAYNIREFGDISSRVSLRRRLQCHNFAWYLDNVFPELKQAMDVNSIFSGQISSDELGTCIDKYVENHLALQPCREHSINQHWNLGTDGTIVSLERIIGVPKGVDSSTGTIKPKIYLNGHYSQFANVIWKYDDKRRLVHKDTGLCLEAVSRSREAVLMQCSTKSRLQKWKIQTRQELQNMFRQKAVPIDWAV